MTSTASIFAWIDKNVDYLEHSKEEPSGFWPHDCLVHSHGSPCIYYLQDEGECELNCLRYKDLSFVEYISLRVEESNS